MERRPILKKPKKNKGLAVFIIILMILGFAVSVYLFGIDAIKGIIHP